MPRYYDDMDAMSAYFYDEHDGIDTTTLPAVSTTLPEKTTQGSDDKASFVTTVEKTAGKRLIGRNLVCVLAVIGSVISVVIWVIAFIVLKKILYGTGSRTVPYKKVNHFLLNLKTNI